MDNEQMYSFAKKYAKKRLSPLKSIKAYCRSQCCAEDIESWKNCSFSACLLYKYRLGLGNRALRNKQHSTQQNSAKPEPSGEDQGNIKKGNTKKPI